MNRKNGKEDKVVRMNTKMKIIQMKSYVRTKGTGNKIKKKKKYVNIKKMTIFHLIRLENILFLLPMNKI